MKKKIPFVIAILVAVGFGIREYLHRPVDLENPPIILGHGGMGVRTRITLNSLKSVEKALAFPIQGTELDVRMTADNELIAFHDSEFPVHTGCPGPVWKKTYNHIYVCSHGALHKAEPVEHLDSLLQNLWNKGTVFSLDLKPENDIDSTRLAAFRDRVSLIVNDHQDFTFFLEGQNLALLSDLKEYKTRAVLFYYAQEFEIGLQEVKERGLDGISINAKYTTKEQIGKAKSENIKVMIWGSGSVLSNRQFLALDADIIQTDDIPSMVKLLGK